VNGLRSVRLRLRCWEDRDRPVFHRLNSDEEVMRFFPYRRSRAEADAVMNEWNANYDRTGLGFLATDRLSDGVTVGIVGLGPTGGEGYPFASTVQIGWRLLPEHCGQGSATEAAEACLRHAFATLALPEIVSYCCVANRPSEAVMVRLEMHPDGEFDHPSVDPATHPHFARHRLYRLRRGEWLAARRDR
jgi:RimJ/RimL family protein N-acetyltransferase